MEKKKLNLIFGGDLTVGNDSKTYMSGVTDLLDCADVRMAHLETAYVKDATGQVCFEVDHTIKSVDPSNWTGTLDSLQGHLDLVTLAGNHFYDFGEQGVMDTLDWLDQHGILHTGGGRNIVQALQPAFLEKDGVKFGILAYNALGPKYSFAAGDKGGCAYVNFVRALKPVREDTAYHENDIYDFKKPVYRKAGEYDCENFPDAASLIKMAEEVAELKKIVI